VARILISPNWADEGVALVRARHVVKRTREEDRDENIVADDRNPTA